jgi:hypothetical protein
MSNFIAVTVKYNRSTRQHEGVARQVDHVVLDGKTFNTNNATQAIGSMVSGWGNQAPLVRVAIINALLAHMGSTQRASFDKANGTINVTL